MLPIGQAVTARSLLGGVFGRLRGFGPPAPAAAPTATSIAVSPNGASIGLAQTQQLNATILDQFGQPFSGTVSWSTSNAAVATVNASGVVTPVAYGSVTITATFGALSTGVSLTVQQPTQVAITTQPGTGITGSALSTQPIARLRDASGFNVAESGRVITVSIQSGAGALAGTLSVSTDSNGVATFTNVAVDATAPPSNFALAFSCTGLTGATSNTFVVNAASADYANEPAGMTALSENPWDALLSGATGTQWTQPLGNNLRNDGIYDMSIVTDATAPQSPTNVFRGHFWAGMPGAGGSFQTSLALPSNSRTFYTCFWWKTTNYTTSGNIHTKQIFLLTSGAILIMQFDALPGSTGMRYSLQMEGGTGNRGVAANYSGDDRNIYTLDALRPGCFQFNPGVFSGGNTNVTGLPYFRDGSNPTGRWEQWAKVEIVLVASTAAGNFTAGNLFGGSRTYGDGILRVWVDGNLAIDCTDISMGSADVTFNTYIMTNTYGGGFNNASQAIDWYYDHIYTSTASTRITG